MSHESLQELSKYFRAELSKEKNDEESSKEIVEKNDGKFILRIPNDVPHQHLTKNQCEFLLQNEKLLKTGEVYDVIIYTVQNDNVKETRAHSIIKNPEILFNSYKFVSLKALNRITFKTRRSIIG
ncbi:hypothetical protein C1646_757721 [Rhizophagus diaphanus]|nr:hypothetical protein C1646_757721 [Rhizophagus diaphanus] [Rhizophagus sp. MUCL 43196]